VISNPAFGHAKISLDPNDKPGRPALDSIGRSTKRTRLHHDFVVVKIVITNKAFPNSRRFIVHTSLWDDVDYTKEDIAALFRRTWQAGASSAKLKTDHAMEHLRLQKTASRFATRFELTMHRFYNLDPWCDGRKPRSK